MEPQRSDALPRCLSAVRTRRTVLGGLLGAAVLALGRLPARTQNPGYSELTISFANDAFQVSPVSAGRTLVTVENGANENLHIFIVRLPEGGGEAELESSDLRPTAGLVCPWPAWQPRPDLSRSEPPSSH